MPSIYQPQARGKQNYIAYTEETLQKCMEGVRSGSISINKASKTFNTPTGTIQNKMKNIHSKSVSHPTIFTKEEGLIASRTIIMCNWGFPLDKLDLRMIVNSYLTKQNRIVKEFTNNIPGDDWVRHFMDHQGLTNRVATNIQRKNAQIRKEQLQEYFNNVEHELKDVPACNFWNYEEKNLRVNPGAQKYVMKRDTKYPESYGLQQSSFFSDVCQ